MEQLILEEEQEQQVPLKTIGLDLVETQEVQALEVEKPSKWYGLPIEKS